MKKYDDIINLPHHVSKNHPKMSNYNRAAQFAPFAALVGYSEAITDSETIYDSRIEISEDKKEEIESVLRNLKKGNTVEIKHFKSEQNSNSKGKYVIDKGTIKKIDDIEKRLIFIDRQFIYFKDIIEIKVINDE